MEEINVLMKRLYEDKVKEKLSEARFMLFMNDYETEHKTIKEKVIDINNQMNEFKVKRADSKRFIEVIKKYSKIKVLDASLLNELIEKIEIHSSKETNGIKTQQIDIYYRFVGKLSNE